MNTINISHRDIILDLSEQLINYLEPLDLTFYFGDDKISLEETFASFGGLGLFLFDKKDKIKEIIEQLQFKREDGQPYQVEMIAVEKNDSTYFGFEFVFSHNLIEFVYYKTHDKAYWEFVLSLTKAILEDKSLHVSKTDKKSIYLDKIYENMIEHINTNKLTIKSNQARS